MREYWDSWFINFINILIFTFFINQITKEEIFRSINILLSYLRSKRYSTNIFHNYYHTLNIMINKGNLISINLINNII